MTTPTHLHVHSHYSLLAGTASVQALAQRAAAEDLSHLALTDSMAMYGQVTFARACKEVGVQPIVGMMLRLQIPPKWRPELDVAPGEMVLLATDRQGYSSLCAISTWLQGGPEREQRLRSGVPWSLLAEHHAGLLAIEGGRRGWAARMLQAGDERAAARYVGRLAGLFDDRAYLGLELHSALSADIGEGLARLSERFGVPLVAVQPVWVLEPDERDLLRTLAAIRHNVTRSQVQAAWLPDGGDERIELHWQDAAEMAAKYRDFAPAWQRTAEVAARCGPALPDGRPVWPTIPLPEGHSPEDELIIQARTGMHQRYGPQPDAAIPQRLERELTVIARHGFAPLFLLVADIVRFARAQDIPVSTRGSVANSLVAYCVGISSVDPVQHDLLFERFLSPARLDPPDIDLDFCSRRRDEVLAYVRQRYGADRVALVSAHSTFRPKSAIREVGKAYGLDLLTIDVLARLFPGRWHPRHRQRKQKTLAEALAEVSDPQHKEVLRTAHRLLRQPHHLSVHAGGMVVAPGPLTAWTPLQWTPKGFAVTQYDHRDIEAIGLPKIDLLGVRALTVLADAAELIRKHHDADFRLHDIPTQDEATTRTLQQGDTIGVFQCESVGARRTLRQLRAGSIADLAIANAFFKPGPATGGMARTFVRRYRGEEPTRYLHPALEPILARTKGVLIFQEQILRVATEIAGLSWEQADHIRRGMSKFQPQEMAALAEQFVAGCQRPPPDGPGMHPQQARRLWEQVQAFAGYGFNQGHATAYAGVSYRSAYLKTHYPAAFFCARLQGHGGFHHPAIYMAEARRLGIAVRGPHVNHSRHRFHLAFESGADEEKRPVLWMGLDHVHELRQQSIRALIAGRKEAPYRDLRDVLQRVPLRRKEITHLIRCGALDGLGHSRAAMLTELSASMLAGDARQLAFDFLAPAPPAESVLQRLQWELALLGYPMNASPLALVDQPPAQAVPLATLMATPARHMHAVVFRLPGWTGGKGYYLADEQDFVIAVSDEERRPPPWQPLLVEGYWQVDEWGMGRLLLSSYEVLGQLLK